MMHDIPKKTIKGECLPEAAAELYTALKNLIVDIEKYHTSCLCDACQPKEGAYQTAKRVLALAEGGGGTPICERCKSIERVGVVACEGCSSMRKK